MGLQSSDLLLVERSGTCYKETFGNRANIEDDDLLLVERSNTKYKCTYADWDGGSGGGGGDGGGGGGAGTGTHEWNASNTASNSLWDFYHTSTGSDSNDAYKIFSDTMTVTGGDGSDTGRLYLGMRMRGTTTYFHDLCIGAIQIIQSGGSQCRTDSTYTNGYDWNAGASLNTTYATSGFYNWETSTGFTHSYTTDPSTLSGWTSLANASTNARWNRGMSTGSSNTGANNGIYSVSQYSGGGGSIIPASGTVAQVSSAFIFTETSGSGYQIGTTTIWLRSPEITIHNNDILRILYLGVGGSTSTNGLGRYDDDTIYFRFK